MATKPTRLQQQAADYCAEALFLISQAFRLDDKGKLDPADFDSLARTIALISSQFPLEDIVGESIERRAKGLSLTSSAAELITLIEGDVTPLQTLLLPDTDFIELVKRLEDEMGDI